MLIELCWINFIGFCWKEIHLWRLTEIEFYVQSGTEVDNNIFFHLWINFYERHEFEENLWNLLITKWKSLIIDKLALHLPFV